MASGICVFAEHWNQELSPAFFELITAAWELKEKNAGTDTSASGCGAAGGFGDSDEGTAD